MLLGKRANSGLLKIRMTPPTVLDGSGASILLDSPRIDFILLATFNGVCTKALGLHISYDTIYILSQDVLSISGFRELRY
jgi:hypothetical protein